MTFRKPNQPSGKRSRDLFERTSSRCGDGRLSRRRARHEPFRLRGVEQLEPRMLLAGSALPNDVDTLLMLRLDDSLTGVAAETPVASTGVSFQAGVVDRAAATGDAGYVRYATADNLSAASGTIEFWIQPTWNGNTGTGHTFFQAGDNFNNGILLAIDGANNLRCIQWGDDPSTGSVETGTERGVGSSGSGWTAGTWYHLAATWNGASRHLQFFVNGQSVGEISNGVTLPSFSRSYFNVGSTINGQSPALAAFDEFRISSRERTAAEILDDYSRGLGVLSSPAGIAADSTGRLLATESAGNRVTIFSSEGVELATLGTGGFGDGQFNAPTDVAAGAADGIYVLDAGNGRVQRFTAEGTYVSKFSGPGTAPGQLASPKGIFADTAGGMVYVADTGNQRVQRFTAAGALDSGWGTSGVVGITGTVCRDHTGFDSPTDVAVHPITGEVYVSDYGNDRIEVFSPAGAYLRTYLAVYRPNQIAFNSRGDLFIAGEDPNDNYNPFDGRLRVLRAGDSLITQNYTGGSLDDIGRIETGVAVRKDGALVAVDTLHGRLVATDDSLSPPADNLNVDAQGTQVTFRWKTRLPVNSVVRFGLTASLGSEQSDGVATTDHAVTVTGLTPGTRIYYSVGFKDSFDGSLRFSTPDPINTGAAAGHAFHRLKVAGVVYTDANSATGYTRRTDLAQAESIFTHVAEFYWRNSTFSLWPDVTIIEINKDITSGYDLFGNLGTDLATAGYSAADDFDAAWGSCVMCPGNYGGGGTLFGRFVGMCEFVSQDDWTLAHEGSHTLDSIYSSMGLSKYEFNHGIWAVPNGVGRDWSINAQVLRNMLPANFTALSGPFTKLMIAPDADSDGVPDSSPAGLNNPLPITEATAGSSSALVDTDGDGLSDLAELMALPAHGADPKVTDTDVDGVADGADLNPVYRMNDKILRATPLLDGSLDASEGWTVLTDGWGYSNNGPSGNNTSDNNLNQSRTATYAAWDDQYFYLAYRGPSAVANVRIDGGADNWFMGPDNYDLHLDSGSSNYSVQVNVGVPDIYRQIDNDGQFSEFFDTNPQFSKPYQGRTIYNHSDDGLGFAGRLVTESDLVFRQGGSGDHCVWEVAVPWSGVTGFHGQDGRVMALWYSVGGDLLFETDHSARVVLGESTANRVPVAAPGGPYSMPEGEGLTLDGAGSSDPDGDRLTYAWDLNNDGLYDDASSARPLLTWAQLAALGIPSDGSNATIGLRVEDGRGGVATAATTLAINNLPPQIQAGSARACAINAMVDFTASVSDPGADPITQVTWNFGDGSPEVTGTLTPSHAFSKYGVFPVVVQATDRDGATGTTTVQVTVPCLDVDNNGVVAPLTDGLLVLRYLFEFRGAPLVKGALGAGAQRRDPDDITAFLDGTRSWMLDVDGNGRVEPMCDGMLLLRYLFDFRGTALVHGAVGSGAERSTPDAIVAFLDGFQVVSPAAWPTEHGDEDNTGRASFLVPQDRLNSGFFDVFLWQKRSPNSPNEGNFESSSMVFRDGAGPNGADLVVGGYHWPKGLQAMDRHTGELIWAGNPDGGEAIGVTSAAFSNDGTVIYVTNDATAHPLMAFRADTGPSAYWSNGGDANPGQLGIFSPQVASDGRIFLYGWADGLYGASDSGQAISTTWSAATPVYAFSGSPAIYESSGRRQVVATGRSGLINAYDWQTGAELWSVNPGYTTDASPTVDPSSGHIYVSMGDGDVYVAGLDMDGNSLWTTPARLAYDWQSGANNPQRAQSAGCLSFDGSTFYFQTVSQEGDGRLYAVNTSDGSVKWTYDTASRGWDIRASSPIVTGNGVIVVGNNLGGTYYAFRDAGTSGQLLDTFQVDAGGNAQASATLSSDGRLYLPLRTVQIAGAAGETPTQAVENVFSAFDLSSQAQARMWPPGSQMAVALNQTVSLSWKAVADPAGQFTHYAVYRSLQPFTTVAGMTPLALVDDVAVTTYVDATAENGIAYYYAVTTLAQGGEITAATSIGPRTPRDETDLQVVSIARQPEYPRYWANYAGHDVTEPSGFGPYSFSASDGLGGGQTMTDPREPTLGQSVTYTATVRNRGTNVFQGPLGGAWTLDGAALDRPVQNVSLAPGDTVTFTCTLTWDDLPHDLTFTLDVADGRSANNSLTSDPLAAPFMTYVDRSFVERFRDEWSPQYPQRTTDDILDWLNEHMAHFNQIFRDAGSRKRVHYGVLQVIDDSEPDPTADRSPYGIFPFRYHVTDGDPRLSGYYHADVDVDFGLLHEMGHQLGLIDVYQLNVSAEQNFVSGTGYSAVACLMNGCSPMLSDFSALAMDHWLHDAHGYFGQFLYDLPATLQLRVLGFDGNPLPGATVKAYQYCDRPGQGKVITDQVKFQGVTDGQGRFTLPNVSIDSSLVPTVGTGDTLHDNPFGYVDVVGRNGVFLFRVEYNGGVDYCWLDITEANVAFWKGTADLAVFDRQLALGGPLQTEPPADMTEGNALDWAAWAEGGTATVANEASRKVAGQSSLKFVTDGGFDNSVSYPRTFTARWDLTAYQFLNVSFYAENPNGGFQSGSPWIRLQDADGNYFQYQYCQNGSPVDLLDSASNRWQSYQIPLDAAADTQNGWRRTAHGSPDLAKIQSVRIHADTWGYGFTLYIDGLGFTTGSAGKSASPADAVKSKSGLHDAAFASDEWTELGPPDSWPSPGWLHSKRLGFRDRHRQDAGDYRV